MEKDIKDALKISELSFSYPQGRQVLSDVSLTLQQGSFTLLSGATACGKTTLLRSLKPELAPVGNKTGSVVLFGKDTRALSVLESSTLVGYVSQSPENQIVCDTVWHELAFGLENLGVCADEMRRRVAEAAYFFGIEPLMEAQTASLSGGQKQAVTLASILVMQPRLLLLDEPTSQLDPVAEKNLLHALFRINHELGITVLVATHAPETMVAYASGALRMVDGHTQPIPLDAFIHDGNQEYAGLGQSDVEQESSLKQPSSSWHACVSLRDAYFRFSQDTPWVLRGADLDVARASIHAIIGGNGSGKSTLLNVIAGTLKLQRGQAKNMLVSKQALLPQDPKSLFVCDSVEEELKEWQKRCGYTHEDIERMVGTLGFTALQKQHPYDLSGGQQQKLALAKLLLTKPALLLLDEPTKGLDPSSKCEIANILLQLKKAGTTIILVTHDLSFISQIADTASMVFDGQITCTEPIRDFFNRSIFYRLHVDGFLLDWHKHKAQALAQHNHKIKAGEHQ